MFTQLLKSKFSNINNLQIKPIINILDSNFLPQNESKWQLLGEQLKLGYRLDEQCSKQNLKEYMMAIQQEQQNEFKCPRKEFLLLGRSNVGKSTLINQIFQQKAAHISKYPGKTRTISFFRISKQDHNLILCDAPGYGFAKRSKAELADWGKLMGFYIQKSLFLHRVIVLIDADTGFQQVDKMTMDLLENSKRPFQIVFSKVDKVKKQQQIDKLTETMHLIKNKYTMLMPFVNFVSSTKNYGINTLRSNIAYVLQMDTYQG